MCNSCRVCSYLLYIFFMIHIINFKLCSRNQNRFFSLIILFDNFQFCRKFFIQKNSPCLRLCWFILCNPDNKIIYRFVIMGCCSFSHQICSIWNCNGFYIAFLICKNFRCSIFTDHNRLCRGKIIISILFYHQRRYQICTKSSSGQ